MVRAVETHQRTATIALYNKADMFLFVNLEKPIVRMKGAPCSLAETEGAFYKSQCASHRNAMACENGQWFWNSDADPSFASKTDAEWTPYSVEDNAVIEQSYQSQATKVELGNYVIYFEPLIQISKLDHNKQRQVKREEKQVTS